MKWSSCLLAIMLCAVITVPMLLGFPGEESDKISVYNTETQETLKLPLEEFLVGVVAAEMPALFEPESLKAQAVAARTYAVSHLQNGEELCTDPAHCQAYADEATLKSRWGANYSAYLSRIEGAVAETAGVIAVYNGEPISAVFHAASSGQTEDGGAVWGTDTPYLKSVASTLPAELNEMETEAVFDRGAFLEALRTLNPAVSDTRPLAGEITRTAAGRVAGITLGGVAFSGIELRTLFSLNSTDFAVNESDTQIFITTRGKGHGVGMSQYGSNELAKAGKSYEEILQHYYQGITLHKLENI